MKKYYSEEEQTKNKKKSSLSLKLKILNIFMPYILSIFFAVFLFAFLGLLSNIKGADIGFWITLPIKGLFSTLGTVFFMVALIYHAIVWKYDLKHKICIRRVICSVITMVLLSTLQHLIEFDDIILNTNSTVYGLFELAVEKGQGGGIVGGLFAILLDTAVNRILALAAIFILLLFMLLQMFNITPFSMIEALFKALGGKPKGEKVKKEKKVKEPKPKKGKKVSVYNDDGDEKEAEFEDATKNHKPAYLDISKYINTDETIVNKQNTKYNSLDDQLISSRGTASDQLKPYSDRYNVDNEGLPVRVAPVIFDDDMEGEEEPQEGQLRPSGEAPMESGDFDTPRIHIYGDSDEDTQFMTSVQDVKSVPQKSNLTPSFEFNAQEKAYKLQDEVEDYDDFEIEKHTFSISSFDYNSTPSYDEPEKEEEPSDNELYSSEAHVSRRPEKSDEAVVIDEDEEYEIIRVPKKNRQEFLESMQAEQKTQTAKAQEDEQFGYLDKLVDNASKPVDPNKALDLNGDFVDNSNCIPTDRQGAKKVSAPPQKKKTIKRNYKFPPIQFLQEPVDNSRSPEVDAELQQNAKIIVETLNEFKTRTRVSDITRGPTVTRYELVPEPGVRVRSIASLSDDIKLKLAAEDIRMECPVPGKSAVGIEVPNKVTSLVCLRDLIQAPQFKKSKAKLYCALGKSISGENVYVDIEKTPHLLVAGATGMGKSVCINSLLVSLLYRTTPDDVRLILIDPKKVELSNYNGVPHLLVPVVVEAKKALGALQWAVTEMETRFETIEAAGVRNLIEFNEKVEKGYDADKMSRIVIVIDELADLKMQVPDIDNHITRLTQKARAAGIHIIIGTQRPSVDVITGLIKSNIPSRISFRVPSQIDSRTVLDEVGAEKLVSRGDMLVKIVGSLYPVRVQGSFVSADEIEQVINFWKENTPAIYDEDVMHQIDANAAKMAKNDKGSSAFDGDDGADDDGELDSAFYEALEIATEMGKISSSFLQRKLRLGFQRAARIIDQMEDCGYIGEANGSKPRDVLITKEDFQEIMMRRQDD